ncbi:MAG: hypothetical protein H7Y37_15535 [Anaerolineae bacterium]|nr:hypothetical protein [Gloeobacterales cyanobacterium ES-bin-313]
MAAPLTRGIHHLGFTVANLALAQAFFIDALNFKLLGENPDYPSSFVTDGVTMITLWGGEAGALPFDRRRQIGLHHAAFAIENLEALSALYSKLQDWPGVEIEGAISSPSVGSQARHFLLRMPGGPRIEFFVSAPTQTVGSLDES